MVTLKRISHENVADFKAVRLRALVDFPTAFCATYACESQLTDQEWLDRAKGWNADGCIGYLAFDEGVPCGLVGCYTEEYEPDRGQVVSMWVDSGFRKTGVGRLLLEGLREWGISRGLRELRLLVTSVNPGAQAFYERLGFRLTGMTQPYPNDASIFESEMTLKLAP
jgi:ribosomal protein S18 acetylase RimI-like enzyme